MIYDGLDVIERYRGLSRGLDVLIDWLGKNDPKDLPLGKTEIDGSRVFANVMEAKTKSARTRALSSTTGMRMCRLTSRARSASSRPRVPRT